MTPTETVVLTEYVQACCPQQIIGEYTPDAWHDLLGDLSLDDCRTAAAEVAKRQPFVAPAEIRAEVRRTRRNRIEHEIVPAPPAELADEPGCYREALRAKVRELADGKHIHRAIGRLSIEGPPPLDEIRKALPPALPPAERNLPPEEIARRQVIASRAARGASIEPDAGEPAA